MRRHHLVTRAALATALLAVALVVAPMASAHHGPPYEDGSEHAFGEMVDYPLVFPVDYDINLWDTYESPRCCDPGEIHHAQDLMAPKMTPVFAAASGTIKYVNWSRDTPTGPPDSRCCTIALDHDDGWESWYVHLNNDTPGTDDGQGWGVAPGIEPGVHVSAGQLIGWVGDSGNAEGTSPHLHFELRDPENIIVNPFEALLAAQANGPVPTCDGLPVTLAVTPGEPLYGTDGNDVIMGTTLDDVIYAGDGDDVVCGLSGQDYIDGGDGDDRLFGGDDRDKILGRRGRDYLDGGKGGDRLRGNAGKDTIVSERGNNRIRGGGGRDLVTYAGRSEAVEVDLSLGRAGSRERVSEVERIEGTPFDDILIGSPGDDRLDGGDGNDTIFGRGGADLLRGRAGNDHLYGEGGDDALVGGSGSDTADGGDDTDSCEAEAVAACES